MIKLHSLNVKNFKSLLDTQIETFGDVNFLYGFNNCGKSNIFKFLKLIFEKKRRITSVEYEEGRESQTDELASRVNFWEGEIYNQPFLFSNNNREIPIEFEIRLEVSKDVIPSDFVGILSKNGFFPKNDPISFLLKGAIISLSTETSKIILKEVFMNEKPFYKEVDGVYSAFDENEDPTLTKTVAERILSVFNDLINLIDTDRNFTKEFLTEKMNLNDSKNFKNWLFELNINAEKNTLFNDLIGFLKNFDFSKAGKAQLASNFKSFPFNAVTDIGFTKFGNELEIMLKNQNTRLPLKNFGTGIQQFFFILSSIFNNNSRIVIVEEIELNLSPLYQRELLAFLKTLRSSKFDQLLFSSHSPFFTLKDSIMVDVLHHVQIGNVTGNSGTTVECYDDPNSRYDGGANESTFTMYWS